MITQLINWIKGLFSTKEESLVLEEIVNHCTSHLRFKKNCPECLKLVGVNG